MVDPLRKQADHVSRHLRRPAAGTDMAVGITPHFLDHRRPVRHLVCGARKLPVDFA
jgi:hypothetical protein